MAHLPVFLAPRGPIIKPTVSQDLVPSKGEWPPIPQSFVPRCESACALWFQQRQVLCFLYPDAWGGVGVRWGVVRCTLTELSASPTPG